jgi:hypothetical protein
MCFRLQTCSSRQEVSDTCDYCHTRVYETEEVWGVQTPIVLWTSVQKLDWRQGHKTECVKHPVASVNDGFMSFERPSVQTTLTSH